MMPLDFSLHLKLMAQMKHLYANHFHSLAFVRSKKERLDFATSRIEKNHLTITSVQSGIDVSDIIMRLSKSIECI